MSKSIDPRLIELLESAAEADELEALVMVERAARESASQSTESDIVDAAVAETHQEPAEVRYLPTLGVFYVRGQGGLLRKILEDERVVSATPSADDFYVPDSSE